MVRQHGGTPQVGPRFGKRMAIAYTESVAGLMADRLRGFFEGWPNPPAPETHLQLLAQSDYAVLALDDESGDVVGFITAITDHVLSAYIPLLEVRRDFRGRGVGSELVRRMLARLDGFYMVDVVCEPDLEPFYARFGLRPAAAMARRDYAHQSGRAQAGPAGPAGDGRR